MSDPDLADRYRAEAAKLRREADQAETVEMRIAMLDAAERFDQLAAEVGPTDS